MYLFLINRNCFKILIGVCGKCKYEGFLLLIGNFLIGDFVLFMFKCFELFNSGCMFKYKM